MRIFVINLARRTDRLEHMRRQLSRFERIDAVDGARVATPHVARFRFWCSKGYAIRPGEIGCVMSHQKVYRRMLDEGIGAACVLEDDETLCGGFEGRVEALEAELLSDVPTVLALADTGAAYLLNRAAAARLLALNTPICSTADDWRRWERGGIVRRRVADLVAVSPYGDPTATGVTRSDIIGDGRQFIVNMSRPRLLAYKAGRLVGRTIEGLMRW